MSPPEGTKHGRPRLVSDAELLELILSAFADLGYEGTSIRALCRRLNVSHNLIHERFGSKERMWYAAVDRAYQQLIAELADAIVSAGDDPLDQLRAGMHRYLTLTATEPALAKIIHHEAARPGPRYDYLFREYMTPINEGGKALLGQLQAEGRVRPGPVAPVYFFLALHGLGAMASHPESFAALGDAGATPQEITDVAVELVLDGLRPPAEPVA